MPVIFDYYLINGFTPALLSSLNTFGGFWPPLGVGAEVFGSAGSLVVFAPGFFNPGCDTGAGFDPGGLLTT